MSCPPAWSPSITIGWRLARAVYSAAVRPAGPEPTIRTGAWVRELVIAAVDPPSARLGIGFVLTGLRVVQPIVPRNHSAPSERPSRRPSPPRYRCRHLRRRGSGRRPERGTIDWPWQQITPTWRPPA